MDSEKLIRLIKERAPLWDIQDQCYNQRDIQNMLWKEVAEEMEAEVGKLKKKWAGLRDAFRKEVNKVMMQNSGNLAAIEPESSSWRYFSQMFFLKNVIFHKILNGKASPIEVEYLQQTCKQEFTFDSNSGNSDEVMVQNYEPMVYQHYLTPTNLPSPEIDNSIQHKTSTEVLENTVDPFIDVSRHAIQLLSETMQQNTDYQFLLSLLPFMMKLPSQRKLAIRTKILQVLIDEEKREMKQANVPVLRLSTHWNKENKE